ncbi:hypothetical protein GEV42_22695 [Pseudomonas aeruginosa]|uniref:hypothetical protein n=2 Tax=Pseudomonas aeruginosa TaxID=287 RepID=UPI00156E39F9|nr:hypothetical protein [Pseudomonas aeruginosa]QPJ58724.1 hypothetical protein GEV42_22695 [Pseudomonas aeruginosa]
MEKMKTLFRNASIATVGLAVANVSFADSLIDETTKEVLTQAGTDGSSVAKLVIAAVAVLVGLAWSSARCARPDVIWSLMLGAFMAYSLISGLKVGQYQ